MSDSPSGEPVLHVRRLLEDPQASARLRRRGPCEPPSASPLPSMRGTHHGPCIRADRARQSRNSIGVQGAVESRRRSEGWGESRWVGDQLLFDT
jgi:hypothetical protein